MSLPPVIWASSGFPPLKNFVKIPTLEFEDSVEITPSRIWHTPGADVA
jgi:hypothetical protein